MEQANGSNENTDAIAGKPLKLIDAAEFSLIKDEEKPSLMGAAHATFFHHKILGERMQTCRLLGYEAARAAGRSEWDVVVVLAHNDPNEVFFKDHPKLGDGERERMIELLTIDETVAYELLLETERDESGSATNRVMAKKARLEFERDWATAHWRWKRYASNFGDEGAEWSAWWIYRQDLEQDPIYKDAKHPWSLMWHDMTELVGPRDGVKFLVLYGNQASVQTAVFVPEKTADTTSDAAVDAVGTAGDTAEPAIVKPEFSSAEAYMDAVRANST